MRRSSVGWATRGGRWLGSARRTPSTPARCAPDRAGRTRSSRRSRRRGRAHGWPDPEPAPGSVPWATGVETEPVPDRRRGRHPARARRGARRGGGRPVLRDGLGGLRRAARDRPRCRRHVAAVPVPQVRLPPPAPAAPPAGTPARPPLPDRAGWREFYADVLHHRPESARARPRRRWRGWGRPPPATDHRFAAWCEGRTGYPIVDAGMRQLLAEGWMHNRLRMIVASFLVKDLHLDWTARGPVLHGAPRRR